MQLVERHQIKPSFKNFTELQEITFRSKKLYNIANYIVRHELFSNKRFINFFELDKILKDNFYYRSLPRQVSQQTLRLLSQNWRAFFKLCKACKKGTVRGILVKPPKYIKSDFFIATFTNQTISKVELQKGYIKLSKFDVKIKTQVKSIRQVRIIPKYTNFVIEVVYLTEEPEQKPNNNRYISIDLGVNNLVTIGSNVLSPIIIKGSPLHSMNYYFDKKKSNNLGIKKLSKLYLKRDNFITNFLHKVSRFIINYCLSNDINTIIIGYNKGWKNHKLKCKDFYFIPFLKLINQIIYKAKLVGINVILTEESYTSKCSFLDSEEMIKKDAYLGKRVYRGLFRASDGTLINADLNGALNILRKVIGDFKYSAKVYDSPEIIIIH